MITETVDRVMAKIESEAGERVCRDERFILNHEIGKVVRQGDIYLHCVAEDHPRGEKLKSRQLAAGTSQGSRHIAEGNVDVYEGVALPEWCGRGYFLGPVIVSTERFPVTHPQHANYSLPAGTYQVTHQTDARTKQRVID